MSCLSIMDDEENSFTLSVSKCEITQGFASFDGAQDERFRIRS